MGQKRWLSFLSLLLLFQSCSLPLIRRDQKGRQRIAPRPDFNPVKKKIAVLPFENEAPVGGDDLAIFAQAELSKELAKIQDFKIDPASSKLFGPSREIYSSAGSKLNQLARTAKLAGVHLIVFGRIARARVRQKKDSIGLVRSTKAIADASIEIRVYDVHSGQEVFSQKVESAVDDKTFRFALSDAEDNMAYRRDLLRYAAQKAVRQVIPALAEIGRKLSWIGRVAKIIGNKIYLNAGRQSGLFVGDIIKVVTEGQEIYDPESGALIGISQGETKGTLEVTDFFGPDGAVSILHSGGGRDRG